MHVDDVAEIDVGLPCVERFLTDLVEADHHLQVGAVAVLECREAQFSGVAREDHPARDADDVIGRGVDRQVGVGGADLSQGVGAFDGDRVGVATLRQQASALVPADPELLGKVCIALPGAQSSRRASLNDRRRRLPLASSRARASGLRWRAKTGLEPPWAQAR